MKKIFLVHKLGFSFSFFFWKTKFYSLTNSREPFISCPADGKVSGILSVPNEEASVNVGSVIQSGTNTEKCLLMEGCYGKAEYFILSLEKFSIYSVVCRSLRCMK